MIRRMTPTTKSCLGAALSLTVGVVLGFGAFTVLQIGPVGRNLAAIAVPTAGVLFFVGLVYGRLWMQGVLSCLGGIAVFALPVAAVVMAFAGGVPSAGFEWSFLLGWVALVMAVTVPAWALGALIGWWSLRFQLTR
jgi:hypothetical protein